MESPSVGYYIPQRHGRALSRPSTSFYYQEMQDVDARHKAGHDAEYRGAWPLASASPRWLIQNIKQRLDILRRHCRVDELVLQRVPERHVEAANFPDLQRRLRKELVHRLLGDVARRLGGLGEIIDRLGVGVSPFDGSVIDLHQASDGGALGLERFHVGDIDPDGLVRQLGRF